MRDDNINDVLHIIAMACFGLALIFGVASVVLADDAFGAPDNATLVIVGESHGGNVAAFEKTAFSYIRNGTKLVINGRCDSACTMAADLVYRAGGNVCVTDNAVFGYHLAYNHVTGKHWNMIYGKEVMDYVVSHGGWVEHGTVDVGHKVLQKWYGRCE